jgi:hypothetical protein
LQGELSDCLGLLVVIPESRDWAEDPLALFSSCAGCLDSVFKGLREGEGVGGGVLWGGHVRDASLLSVFGRRKRGRKGLGGVARGRKGFTGD